MVTISFYNHRYTGGKWLLTFSKKIDRISALERCTSWDFSVCEYCVEICENNIRQLTSSRPLGGMKSWCLICWEWRSRRVVVKETVNPGEVWIPTQSYLYHDKLVCNETGNVYLDFTLFISRKEEIRVLHLTICDSFRPGIFM